MVGKLAEHFNHDRELFGITGKLAGVFGLEQHLRKLSGGELKANLRDPGRVVFTEVISQVILRPREMKLAFLFGAPVFVAASGFPVGDIALSDIDFVLTQGASDFRIANVFEKQIVDEVAVALGQASDLAVTRAFGGGARFRRRIVDDGDP